MIVGLGHQARVGKDTAAQILVDKYGFKRLAFADRLKEMALAIDPMVATFTAHAALNPTTFPVHLTEVVEREGFEKAKEWPEVRRFLQRLGVGAREHIEPEVWVKAVTRQIDADPTQDWVITDVRFPNEFHAIDTYVDRKLIKIVREGVESNAGAHVSETALADYPWPNTIHNDGTIDDLERMLVGVLGL